MRILSFLKCFDLVKSRSAYRFLHSEVLCKENCCCLSYQELITLRENAWMNALIIDCYLEILSQKYDVLVVNYTNTKLTTYTDDCKYRCSREIFLICVASEDHFTLLLVIPKCENYKQRRIINFDQKNLVQYLKQYQETTLLSIQKSIKLQFFKIIQ